MRRMRIEAPKDIIRQYTRTDPPTSPLQPVAAMTTTRQNDDNSNHENDSVEPED